MAGINPKSDQPEQPFKDLLLKAEGLKLPPVKRNAQPEFELQCACMTYLKMQYKHLFAFHPANERKVKLVGKKKIPVEGNRLKQAGVKKGLLDIFILDPFENQDGDMFYVGTVIELKAPGRIKDTSVDQEDCIRELKARNFYVEVVDSFDRFKQIIDLNYG